ncbi:hypothetical protein QL285_074548 [Trifolium repens]|nr:hypothetical protein QL285_074548 [Trifolium repens]
MSWFVTKLTNWSVVIIQRNRRGVAIVVVSVLLSLVPCDRISSCNDINMLIGTMMNGFKIHKLLMEFSKCNRRFSASKCSRYFTILNSQAIEGVNHKISVIKGWSIIDSSSEMALIP